jgi:two-component system sensor histidine kinase PilS (NtrC family)
MSDLGFLVYALKGEKGLNFLVLLKIALISLLALLFFIDLESWQIIHSSSLYSKRILTLVIPFAGLFLIFNLKKKVNYKKLIFSVCLLDVCFLLIYALFNPLPLNLFVGFLSLNLVTAGLFLTSAEVLFVFSLTLLSFTVFLEDRLLLNSPYSSFYFVFNSFSFVVYSVSALFLQKFFIGSSSTLGQVSEQLMNQEELNQAVLSSVDSAVLIGTEDDFKPLNAVGSKFYTIAQNSFSEYLKNKNRDFSEHFEIQNRQYRVEESNLRNSTKQNQKVWLVTDETERLKTQSELEQTRKLSAIGQLSAGLAHEIRNPLAGISGSVELIKDGGLDELDTKKLFKTVLKEIDRLNALVTDFLGFASPEVKTTDKIETTKFFEEMVGLIKLDPRSEGVALSCEVENHILLVDENKLKQVFINLIINAFQAFSKKAELYPTSPKVSLTGRYLDSGYEIKVEDNGDGIKKENLASIFEPFHTTKDKGTGLGLALSHRILDGHGASIDVESVVDSGTTFTILFKNK